MTLDQLAGGDPLKYKQVLEVDADTVLRKLSLESAKAAYGRRLSRIRNQKKP